MKFYVMTLFPEMIETVMSGSIIGRAARKGLLEVHAVNIRDFSTDKHKHVDDTPYGGGAGMLLRCEPIYECIDAIKTDKSHIIILSPEGMTYNQKKASELTKYEHLIIICGHYEGFDERIKLLADEVISIGDYILTGGEIPAMALIDSITRLIPGVINKESLESESFDNNLLDYPMYTKPRSYRGMDVPDVLISGDHAKIKAWREEKKLEKTKDNRPDLMEKI